MTDRDSKTHDSERTTGEQRDASADWKTEYFHQGVRSVGAFTARNGDHENVAGPRSGVTLSDYADGEGGARDGDDRNGEGDR